MKLLEGMSRFVRHAATQCLQQQQLVVAKRLLLRRAHAQIASLCSQQPSDATQPAQNMVRALVWSQLTACGPRFDGAVGAASGATTGPSSHASTSPELCPRAVVLSVCAMPLCGSAHTVLAVTIKVLSGRYSGVGVRGAASCMDACVPVCCCHALCPCRPAYS
jgi:hypothetical protein